MTELEEDSLESIIDIARPDKTFYLQMEHLRDYDHASESAEILLKHCQIVISHKNFTKF